MREVEVKFGDPRTRSYQYTKSPAQGWTLCMVGVTGLGHLRQPRNFVFENRFSREDCLEKCHWHFSPPISFGRRYNTLLKPMKKPPTRTTLSLVGVRGLEPPTSRPPAVRASQLRHTPIGVIVSNVYRFWGHEPHGHDHTCKLLACKSVSTPPQLGRIRAIQASGLTKCHWHFSPQPYALANCATPRRRCVSFCYSEPSGGKAN